LSLKKQKKEKKRYYSMNLHGRRGLLASKKAYHNDGPVVNLLDSKGTTEDDEASQS